MFGAGRMRDVLVFQRRFQKEEPDVNGQIQLEWQDIGGAIPASVKPERSGELILADRRNSITTWRIRTHYDADLAGLMTSDRAVDADDSSRTFVLKSIVISDMHDSIDIVAESGGPT